MQKKKFPSFQHLAYLTRMERSSLVIGCIFCILVFLNAHILTVFNVAFNCRPGLLVTTVLVALTLFLNFDFCCFLWHFWQHQAFSNSFHMIVSCGLYTFKPFHVPNF